MREAGQHDRRGPRARRRRGRRHVRLHGRRHRARGDDSDVGAGGRRPALMKRLADPEIRARLKQEIVTGSPGWSNLVEAAGGWDRIVLANARNAANAKFDGKTLAAIATRVGQGPGRCGVRSRRAGQRPRDGDLPHDERARRRDGAALSVDQHRQRCRRGGRRRRPGSDRPHASARVRQLPARDRALRARARRAHARGGDSQDDVVAGHAHAPGRPRRDPRRPLGRRRRLRLRHAAGPRDLRRAARVARRHRLRARQRHRS